MARRPNLQTREKVLHAARELIVRNGYKGVSMDDIARAADLKKANLFHYYPSKESLGFAVFEFATRNFRDRWAERLERGQDPVRLVETLFEDLERGMSAAGCCGGCLVGNLAQEISDSNEALRRRIAEHFAVWEKQLEDFFERHVAEGTFKPQFSPTAAAQAIIEIYQGSLLFAKATRRPKALASARAMASGYLRWWLRDDRTIPRLRK